MACPPPPHGQMLQRSTPGQRWERNASRGENPSNADETLPPPSCTTKPPQDADAASEHEPGTSKQDEGRRKRRRVVGFSTVEIYSHAPCLAGDRVTSTPGPPVGLGALSHIGIRRVESYDEDRGQERDGVQYLPEDARRGLVIPLSRSDSIDEVIDGVSLTREQRKASLSDPISPRSPRPVSFPSFPVLGPGESSLAPLTSLPPLGEEPSLTDLFG